MKTNKTNKKKPRTESRTILTKYPPTTKLFARELDGIKQSAQWCQQLCVGGGSRGTETLLMVLEAQEIELPRVLA